MAHRCGVLWRVPQRWVLQRCGGCCGCEIGATEVWMAAAEVL